MDDLNVFVGGLSGIFKGLKTSRNKGVHNVRNLQKLKEITVRNEVTAMNWADKMETEILIGYGSQLVKIFDLKTNAFTYNEERRVGDGTICGIFKLNDSLVTAVESGMVKVWDEHSTTLDTGGPLNRMRQNPSQENIIGTGGKENDLKLWDLETGKTTFQAKNVRHDELELRVPVWVMDLAFKPDSSHVAVATRYGQVRLYDPSTPTRRPVCQFEGKDLSFTCIANAPKENHVVVGCTTGNMFLLDLRGKGLLVNKYRGFMGSVRQVVCPAVEPYVFSVSLDRHFRVHHLNTKKLLFKEYMQSRLSALLVKSSFTMEDIKEEVPDVKEANGDEVDEEYENMFEQMEVITDKQAIEEEKPKSKKKTKSKIEVEGKEEYQQLFDEMEEVTEKQNVTEKRTKSKAKSKTKRLKKQEVIVVD
uniref:WD repeat-containing protein 74 n=1 Tax=Graphocephala atropunctata TaxID=36148 RepID=A0A1B6LEY6_9HEMI